MSDSTRVVFDCNVYLQALAKPTGPAGRCVDLALNGSVALFISPGILDEVRDVTTRPELTARFKLRAERVDALLDALPTCAIVIAEIPEAWSYDRDPSDAQYVNLAIVAGATRIVSRDRDLLDLMDLTKPGAKDFQARFPTLRIVDPVQLLRECESRS
jgi:putative PIN family toxin of toxin-antitoxin system